MTDIRDAAKRPLPSFAEWLEKANPDGKAPGFEGFADLARRTQEQDLQYLDPTTASFGRMWMGAAIAAVELCQMEMSKHDRPPGEIVAQLPRVFACATMYAVASILESDSPFREIAKMLSEEFRAATKVAADDLTESAEADAAGPNIFGPAGLMEVAEAPDFGPCCACLCSDKPALGVVMLPLRAGIPGTGWGCVSCNLPQDGAVAVMCESCIAGKSALQMVCEGFVTEKGRRPISDLSSEPFDHTKPKEEH